VYMGGIELNPSLYNRCPLLGEYSLFLSLYPEKEVLCS